MVALLEFGVLVLIAWPLLRAAVHPALRRAYPRTTTVMAILVLVWAAGAGVLGFWFPRLLHLVTALAAGGATFALLHGLPGYGRSRRLPPGSLSLLPFDYLMDPFFFSKQIERHGWVFKMNQFGFGAGPNPFRGSLQPVCCVDMKRGIKILNDHDEILIPPVIPSSRFIPKKYLREMKREDHSHYRQIFSSAFKREIIDESAEFMTRHVRASLLRLADQSSSNGSRGVAPENFLLSMTFGVFVRCFFGILPDDERFGLLEKLSAVIDLTNRDDREVSSALDEFAGILRQEAQRVAASNHNSTSSFLSEIARAEPAAFDDLTAIRNFIYIMTASWIDTSGLITWLFKELSEHPDWTTRLPGDIQLKATDGTEPLSVRCVRETLRLRQSEYLYRRVLDDLPVEDFVIPKGWLLRVCIRESHRDPRVFDTPNEFNPDRFLARSYPRAEYSTFGASRISCLGEYLTLTLGQIFVEEFALNIETSTREDGPLEYRKWHWKPSSKWKVHVSRRDRQPSAMK